MIDSQTGVSVAVLIKKGDELLCVRQCAKKGGQLSIPAGHLKLGEMVVDGTMREIREETGYKIALLGLVGIYNRSKEGSLRIAFAFTGCIVGGEENPQTDEIAEIKWFKRDEVRTLISSEDLYRPDYSARILTDWLSGIVYPLDIFKEIR